jgi:hypothetical protein
VRTNIIVVDDFYNNPDSVRNFALSQSFDVKGNFPGSRTKEFLLDGVKNTIQEFVKPFSGKFIGFSDKYSGSFQIATAKDRTWIHADNGNKWAGVCYLTPNAPHTGGTGLFRHKETAASSIFEIPKGKGIEAYDYTKWDLVDVIGNKFNRLVLYRGDLFHASLDYFGKDNNDGRLFQLFFFDTEF